MQSDRTHEVEQRVKAIRITAEDTCGFFSQKNSFVAGQRCCLHCAYGDFGRASTSDETNSTITGLCKYRLREHKPSALTDDALDAVSGGVLLDDQRLQAEELGNTAGGGCLHRKYP